MPNTKRKSKNKNSSKKSKKKNPLYVVTNDGRDVESANSLWDAAVKKFNLQPAIDLLWRVLELMAKQVNSYAALVWLQKELHQLNQALDQLMKRLAPWLFFYKA